MSNYYAIATTFVPGTKVRSDEVNAELTAISGGFDLLPTASDAIVAGRAYRGVEAGSGNSYTITMDDTRTAYSDGDRVLFKATHSNTGAASLKLDALSLISLTNADGTTCVVSDIVSGQYYEAVYSSVSNKWQLLSPNASVLVGGALLVGYAQEWAVKAEDSLISVAAGGDGATDYSSLHWAAKAAADVVLTNADVVITNADVLLTNADVVSTNADVVSTNADVVLTNADVTYVAEWAIKAEDSLISVAAGGNGTTDYSALHWAAKSEASATAAAASESNADGYATAASADAVSTAADAVATAADAVSTAADAVSTDADATSSAASAAAAATSYDDFDDRYLGDKASDPTLDNDGDALLTGALYWNTVNNTMRAYTGTVWQDVGSSTANVTVYTATAGQTSFSGADDNALVLSYTVGFLQVYLNGILLEDTTDYTATTGTSIVLTVGANLGDILQGLGFGTFDVANTYTKTEIDANTYSQTQIDANIYTKTQSDANKYDKTETDALLYEKPRGNLIDNGLFRIWQRGTTKTASSSEYLADRWKLIRNFGSGGVVTQARAGNPSQAGIHLPFYYYWYVTATTTDVMTTGYLLLSQSKEGLDIAHLRWGMAEAKDLTIGFWHSCTKTGTYCLTFRNDDNTRSYTAEYTQVATNEWEYTTVTIPGDTGGTWNSTTADQGLEIMWNFAGTAGSVAADTWLDGANTGYTTANQVNSMDSTSNTQKISGVRMVAGDVDMNMPETSFHDDLMKCYRYYAFYPKMLAGAGACSTTTNARCHVLTPAPLRSGSPSIETVASEWRVRGGSTNHTPSAVAVNTTGNAMPGGVALDFTIGTSTQYRAHTAYCNNSFAFEDEI